MKLLLQILWGWSVLANGAVGIQVGTVQTNNQNIKLMKFNYNNPAWLQGAGNAGKAKEYITMVFSAADQSAIISSQGDLLVSTIKNGQTITAKYSNLDNSTIRFDADANSVITVSGKVTALSAGNGPYLFSDLVEVNLRNAKSLTYLNCRNSQLTSLDVSANTALTSIQCQNNQLTSLDISANTALTDLYCSDNQLTSLDISANTALKNLSCGSNQLTSLDTSANTALIYLNCYGNQLTSLDTSANTEMYYLICRNNQLTSLDISANTALEHLECSSNEYITTIKAVAVYNSVASKIASLITDATATDGTVTLRNGDEFNSIISDAATTKGWTVEYVDA